MPIVNDLSKLCEYMYRKGVYDAAMHSIPNDVKDCADRDDGFTTYRFLTDYLGHEIKYRQYKDTLQVFCNAVNADHLRNFLAYAQSHEYLKRGICTVCDAVYRDGLRDGLYVSIEQATDFMDRIKRGGNHERIDRPKLKQSFWIDTIKYKANNIYYIHLANEKPSSMDKLANFIAKAIMENGK